MSTAHLVTVSPDLYCAQFGAKDFDEIDCGIVRERGPR
jgi:hypothetical protein